MDRALEETVQLVVLGELADFFDRYSAFHGVRSRRSGGTMYLEIFLEFDGALRMSEVQRTIDEMRHNLEGKIRGSRVAIVLGTRPIDFG
jgi:divalent metal cation (Fe/Co/Zn/Cd) transporter